MKPARRLPDPGRVYGPNGTPVAALVERCRVLTPAELRRLQVALPSWFLETTDEARVAAFLVAQNAGREKAWKATFRAVGDAVERAIPRALIPELSGAIFGVPALAAVALVVRDLITPEQYDALVKPWLDAGMTLP
jgi:hypothetical protein